MKKKILCIMALLSIFSTILISCGKSSTSIESKENENFVETINAEEDFITVIDEADREVKVPKKIDRIAVLDIFPIPSVLSVFFDSAKKIVAMAPSSMSAAENSLLSKLYPEILNADTSCISGANVNIEELMKANPDIVFYSAENTILGDNLLKSGFSAVAISPNKWHYDCIETLKQWLNLLSIIFPNEANDRVRLVSEFSDNSLNLIKERTKDLTDEERERVFFLFQYSDEAIVTSGENFFGEWWARSIGAINVANELKKDNSVKATFEEVYKWNPSSILMTNFNKYFPDDLYNNTVGSYDWSEIKAIKDKKVYKMPLGMYRSYTPGIDTPITLLWMAKTIYPNLFEDIDIVEETKKYYKNIFGIDLSDDDAKMIFEPNEKAGKVITR